MIGKGSTQTTLSEDDVRHILAQTCEQLPVNGRRVLVLIPDGTRTAPIPLMFRLLYEQLGKRVERLDYLIALGTHAPMSQEHIESLLGVDAREHELRYPNVHIFNHEWDNPEILQTIGTISRSEANRLTDGLLVDEVPVTLNRRIFDYDHLLVCGPVFPHEVAGFSGGNKYFFPGISGPDVIDATHWLGALMTSNRIIGAKDTPVRQVINRAASLIPRPKHAFCCVVSTAGVHGVFFGDPEAAFAQAADLSAKIHIRTV